MCKWICCCFYGKHKKVDKKRDKKGIKLDKKVNKQIEKPLKQLTKDKTLSPKAQEIESFYSSKEDTEDKKKKKAPTNAWERESVTPSEIEDTDMFRTYDLPFKSFHTIDALMTHLGYELSTQVGQGAYGIVRKSYHYERLGRKKVLACKEIPIKKTENKDKEIRNLKREIFVLRKCKHPYIVALVDHFAVNAKSKTIAFLFMEFADGNNLSVEIYSGTMTQNNAKRYLIQLSIGITYLHKLKIAHKDLKPENVLLIRNEKTGRLDIRVADFGLSQSAFKKKEGVIKTGHYGGTRAYMAPEIVSLEVYKEYKKVLSNTLEYNPFKSDMWALGIILYEMFSRQIPFDFHNWDNMLQLQLKQEFSYPTNVRQTLVDFEKIDDLTHKLLQPDVDKRLDPFGLLIHPWLRDEVDFKLIDVTETHRQS